MVENNIKLSGTIYRIFVKKINPSGIPYYQFMLDHHSLQQESGFSRQARCCLSVMVSGNLTFDVDQHTILGKEVIVQGFINCHQRYDGLSRIVLHAKKIDLITSGE
ncbi:primosomal replication protein N [Sodalis sp. CWE]|uniref:primosomal replication protein N n=1 Tax=Sodalis sp. CWE TaxID=2803816 RepID=UPI001C7CC086|nr:primosomal replication protein N [Sodalis sp. CWE]MBX4180801.1 primosomal replication protein N [Sodalis sp. CWE]